jgi:beta-galactosidase
MESSPGATNWRETSKKKREGMHALSSLQAIAHGSDSVMYFQWRQSRGCAEKFHDAVVSHYGTGDTRIFREVAKTGSYLKKLETFAGTCVAEAQVAVVYDFQNEWALNNAKHPRNTGKNYQKECINHYGAFWRAGIHCDVIGIEYEDFNRYRLLVLPMLYLLSEETAEKLRAFVKQGGALVATYMTGLVNGNDLCYLGGTPGLLTDVFGLAVEETDVIADYENQRFTMDGREWQASHYADRVRLRGAQALAEFNAPNEGVPAVCVHQFEKGEAYYLCARFGREFLDWFYPDLCGKHSVSPCVSWKIPAGISVQKRGGAAFVMNFNSCETPIAIGEKPILDLLSGETVCNVLRLAPYGVAVLKE